DVFDYQLIHVTGTAKLVEVPVERKLLPNFFLTAFSVFDKQLLSDSKQVVVPPEKHFLNLEVKADKNQYQPKDEGTLEITARDNNGNPVSTEVSLGLIDSSVLYIQRDLVEDPRKF